MRERRWPSSPSVPLAFGLLSDLPFCRSTSPRSSRLQVCGAPGTPALFTGGQLAAWLPWSLHNPLRPWARELQVAGGAVPDLGLLRVGAGLWKGVLWGLTFESVAAALLWVLLG